MRRMSKAERISRQRLLDYLNTARYEDEELSLDLRALVPNAWHTLEHDLDVWEEKVKITLRLDKSVAQFYRAMGQGYQAQISRILALWAHMKIAGALRTEEAVHAQLAEWNKRNQEDRDKGEEAHSYASSVETPKEALPPGQGDD